MEESNAKPTPAFTQARDQMIKQRLGGPRKTTYQQLVLIAETLGLTYDQMDNYLGLKPGSFRQWLSAAPHERPPTLGQ